MSKVVFEWVEREECDQRHSFLGSLGGIVVKEQDNGHKYILSSVCVCMHACIVGYYCRFWASNN